MLESYLYSDNAFVTLTYDDEHLPSDGSVSIVEYQLWLKRLRKAFAPRRFRFFIVGEYGDKSERPHYHAALFNYPTCARGRTRRRPGSTRPIWRGCCASCELVGNTWKKGDVDLGILEANSAQYISRYTVKKMTAVDDIRLRGRHPEFSKQSRRPGIGHDFMHEVASQWLRFNLETSRTDVPSVLRHGQKMLPIGRYLKRRLRVLVGKDEKASEEVLSKLAEELQALREYAFENSLSFAKVLEEDAVGLARKLVVREKIWKSKDSL